MKTRTCGRLVVVACGLVITAAGYGADEKKANATGTWKSEFTTQNGQTITTTFKLKQEGDKLTGTASGRGGEAKIEDGKVKGDQLSFQITRERNGNTFTIKYKGKVSGDTIKGKVQFNFGGEERERDWEAKREKAEK
jgi:hypothetical protein